MKAWFAPLSRHRIPYDNPRLPKLTDSDVARIMDELKDAGPKKKDVQ